MSLSDQMKTLSYMKKLIKEKKRKFQIRNDRDYLAALLDLGITEEEAWEQILYLNSMDLVIDWKPSYYRSSDTLVFKKKINGILSYIKLKLEKDSNGDITVCLSFHRNERF